MDSAAIFSSLRRRSSPSLEAFLAPVDLSDVALVRKKEVFLVLLEYTRDFGSSLS